MVLDQISKYKELFNQVSNSRCTTEQLTSIKLKYSDIIRSKRRMEQITSMKELLNVLEKRDYLNVDKIEPFQEIAVELKDHTLIRLLSCFDNSGNNVNFNPVHRDHNGVPLGVSALPPPPKGVKRVYDCIASDIGQKWTNFARALQVPEGVIDDLCVTRDFSSRVYYVLMYHEKNCDPQSWKNKLLDALTVARRNDLRKKVERIFNTTHEN